MCLITGLIKIPLHKKLLSYLVTQTLRKQAGAVNPHLELLLHQGRLQLATADALYSDGDKYTPALAVVRELKELLPALQSVLVLGGGLASLPHILTKRGYKPAFTIVEIDKVVLGWALELLAESGAHINPVCMDAAVYMERNTTLYDLVFIDIFNGLEVPDFVTTPTFLQQCRKALSPHGRLAFNYISHSPARMQQVQEAFYRVFPGARQVQNGVNTILIS